MILALKALTTENEPEQIYRRFIKEKGATGGISTQTPAGFAQARLFAMARGSGIQDTADIQKVWNNLEPNVRAILTNELNCLGTSSDAAVLIYYAPALIQNMKRAVAQESPENITDGYTKKQEAYKRAFFMLAEIYQATRVAVHTRKNLPSVVVVTDIHDLAQTVATQPQKALSQTIKAVIGENAFGQAMFKETMEINLNTSKNFISDCLPHGRSAFIGIGGGSDCVQAMQLSRMAHEKPACIISVRADKTQSQSAKSNLVGQDRTPIRHGGIVTDGVYRVTPETTAPGRFMESMIAGKGVPVYLVLDNGEHLKEQLEAVLKEVGSVQNVIAVDTGGDCLYVNETNGLNNAETTPDQDYRSLKAIYQLDKSYRKMTAVLALGVDAPIYAEQVLSASKADIVSFAPQQIQQILQNYRALGMDGSTDNAFGKTPLALQAALKGEMGVNALPLPETVVLNRKNPWNPFVVVTPTMCQIALMPLENHFETINCPAKSFEQLKHIKHSVSKQSRR